MTAERQRDHLTPSEAARILGVSPRTVSRWADQGWLSHIVTLGGHRRFSRDAVEAMEHHLAQAGAPAPGSAPSS